MKKMLDSSCLSMQLKILRYEKPCFLIQYEHSILFLHFKCTSNLLLACFSSYFPKLLKSRFAAADEACEKRQSFATMLNGLALEKVWR